MRYKYYYCKLIRPDLIDYLNQNQIKYELWGPAGVPKYTIFSLWSSSPSTESHIKSIEALCGYTPLTFLEFTKKDFEQAKFMVIRSKNQTIDIINGKSAYITSCEWIDLQGHIRANHICSIGTICIEKEPPIKSNTALWLHSTGFSVFFADYRVRDMVIANNLSGVEFKEIFKKDGTVSDKLYHMTTNHVVPTEVVGFGHGEKISKCPLCGKERYFGGTAYQLHLDCSKISTEIDFYRTESIWGEEITEPKYIISQRFYRLLKENGLAGKVVFEPVVDISSNN